MSKFSRTARSTFALLGIVYLCARASTMGSAEPSERASTVVLNTGVPGVAHSADVEGSGLGSHGLADEFSHPLVFHEQDEGMTSVMKPQEVDVTIPKFLGIKRTLSGILGMLLFVALMAMASQSDRAKAKERDFAASVIDRLNEWTASYELDGNPVRMETMILWFCMILTASGISDLLMSLFRRREARAGFPTPPNMANFEVVFFGAALMAVAIFGTSAILLELAFPLLIVGMASMLYRQYQRRQYFKEQHDFQDAAAMSEPQ